LNLSVIKIDKYHLSNQLCVITLDQEKL
jgi:hypothetical protein